MFLDDNSKMVLSKTMKNSEWMILICYFVGFAAVLLKVPWWFHYLNLNFEGPVLMVSTRTGSTRLYKKLNRAGTIILISVLPLLFFFTLSLRMIFEYPGDAIAEKPLIYRWLLTMLFTGCWSLMFLVFLGLFLVAGKCFKAIGEMFVGILKIPLALSGREASGSTEKGSKKKRSFFEQMGYDLGKGEVAGVEENLPGNEWKYQKDDEEDDEDGGEDGGGFFKRRRN